MSMANVSFEYQREDDDFVVTHDSAHYCSLDFHSLDVYDSDSQSPISNLNRMRRSDHIFGSDLISNFNIFNCQNQVNFVRDLFQQRVEQLSSGLVGDSDFVSNLDLNFGVIEGNEEMGSTHLELDLGLGLGLGFCGERHDLVEDGDSCGFMVANGSGSESSEPFLGGLGVFGVDSDLDLASEEDEIVAVGIDLNAEDDFGSDNVCDDDMSIGLCLDSFQLEDQRNGYEDFEWEEVDGRVEASSIFFGDADEDLDASVSAVIRAGEVGVEGSGALGNTEWEVLLNVRDFGPNAELEHESMPYLEDHDGEYEMIFGQFTENENASVVRPSASRAFVKNLPSVVLTREDVENNNALCAVCKDDINVGEQAKQLPCFHLYHGDCIQPWLAIRNTCPVCRYELPTDDLDYERRRTQRADLGQ